jgi:hypothetical protein
MISWSTCRTLCLAGTISALLFAVPALGAPADDEYLPRVPNAAGEPLVAGGTRGAGATILQPAVRGAKPGKAGQAAEAGGLPIAGVTRSSGGGGGGNTLLDPAVLLMIAGAIAAAVGMTLRHRGAQREPAAEPQPNHAIPRAERPTPEGVILGGGGTRKGAGATAPSERDKVAQRDR